METSQKNSIDTNDLAKIVKVIGYTVATTLVTTLLSYMPQIQETIHLEPNSTVIGGLVFSIVNVLLVGIQKYLKNNA